MIPKVETVEKREVRYEGTPFEMKRIRESVGNYERYLWETTLDGLQMNPNIFQDVFGDSNFMVPVKKRGGGIIPKFYTTTRPHAEIIATILIDWYKKLQ